MNVIIFVIISIVLLSSTVFTEQAFAICDANIDYVSKLASSELVFTGTVTRLDNYDGPQKVTFLIHDVIKGKIDTPKYVLENTGTMFLENDMIMSSSVGVDYKIGKTYKVYVENGKTDRCTTMQTAPPAGYMWEPGPEDGNYYSDEQEEPSRQYQDANERESYRDALASGAIVFFAEPPKLSDNELDSVMDKLLYSELDRSVLPIASIAIDYDRDTLVLWTPDLTIGDKVQEVIDDVSFVLLYEEAPARWVHDGPKPEPEPTFDPYALCPPGKVFDWDICVDECPFGQIAINGICQTFPFEDPTSGDFRESGNNTGMLYAFSSLGLVGIIVGFFVIKKWRNKN